MLPACLSLQVLGCRFLMISLMFLITLRPLRLFSVLRKLLLSFLQPFVNVSLTILSSCLCFSRIVKIVMKPSSLVSSTSPCQSLIRAARTSRRLRLLLDSILRTDTMKKSFKRHMCRVPNKFRRPGRSPFKLPI